MIYWRAFADLSPARMVTQAGPSGIPLSEISSWLDLRGVTDSEARLEYVFFIRQLDTEFLSYSNEQMKQASDRSKAKVQTANTRRR